MINMASNNPTHKIHEKRYLERLRLINIFIFLYLDMCCPLQQIASISMQGVYCPQADQQIITQHIIVQEEGRLQHYPLSYYEVGKHLGRCPFGNYYEVRKYRGASTEQLGVSLIMKVIKNANSQLAKSIYQNQVRNLEFLKEKNVKGIVKCVRHWMYQGTCYIAFEKCKYGSLQALIQSLKSKGETLSQQEILYILRETLKAVQQLHNNGVTHGNLKPENIIIGDNMEVKIMDFTLSQIAEYQQLIISYNCGTPRYMAPELFSQGRQCSKKSDIWAIGIVLYYLIQQKQPFNDSSIDKFKTKLKKAFQIKVSSKQIDRILQKMVDKTPKNREQSQKLLQNELFKKTIDSNSIINKLKKRFEAFIYQQSSRIQSWKRKIDSISILHPKNINSIISRINHEKVTILHLVYQRQYGYFALLSNFSVIAYFNNRKVLKLQQNMLFSANSNEQKVIVRVYRQHFSSIINKQFIQSNQNEFAQMTCTIKDIIIVKGNVIIRLSNKVFHIFFYQKLQHNSALSFTKSVSLNYHKINPSLLKFQQKGDIQQYQIMEKGLKSTHQRYLEYTKQVFQILIENSMIPMLKTNTK